MKKLMFAACFCLTLSLPFETKANSDFLELTRQLQALTSYLQELTRPYGLLNPTTEKEIILNSAEWIMASQLENGRYGYEYWPYEDRYSNDNNTVRQAGTFSALADIYRQQTEKDEAIAESLEKSVAYFTDLTIEIDDEDDGVEHKFSCILRDANARRCDLGATALVLVGLFSFIEANPDKREQYGDLIDEYAAFLLAARHPGAGFSNRYLLRGGFDAEESPFFNGEAMLALVRYYQYEPDQEIQVLLEDVFTYLSAKKYESPLYLWIMATLKDMNQLWPNGAYTKYAKDFTELKVADAARRRGATHNYCAALEGMASAYSILEDSAPETFLNRLYSEIEFWLYKSAKLQLHRDEPYRVLFVDGQLSLVRQTDTDLAHGGFLTGETELTQRIDFTQHCVSAYLQKYVDIDKNSL